MGVKCVGYGPAGGIGYAKSPRGVLIQRVPFRLSGSLPRNRGFSPRRCLSASAGRAQRTADSGAITIVLRGWAAGEGSRKPDLAFGLSLRPAPAPLYTGEAPLADLCRGSELAPERSRTAAEDAPERLRRIPTPRSLRKEPKRLPTLGLPSHSEKARSFPSGRPAGLLEAATAPCWMLCSLSEENPPASPKPRY